MIRSVLLVFGFIFLSDAIRRSRHANASAVVSPQVHQMYVQQALFGATQLGVSDLALSADGAVLYVLMQFDGAMTLSNPPFPATGSFGQAGVPSSVLIKCDARTGEMLIAQVLHGAAGPPGWCSMRGVAVTTDGGVWIAGAGSNTAYSDPLGSATATAATFVLSTPGTPLVIRYDGDSLSYTGHQDYASTANGYFAAIAAVGDAVFAVGVYQGPSADVRLPDGSASSGTVGPVWVYLKWTTAIESAIAGATHHGIVYTAVSSGVLLYVTAVEGGVWMRGEGLETTTSDIISLKSDGSTDAAGSAGGALNKVLTFWLGVNALGEVRHHGGPGHQLTSFAIGDSSGGGALMCGVAGGNTGKPTHPGVQSYSPVGGEAYFIHIRDTAVLDWSMVVGIGCDWLTQSAGGHHDGVGGWWIFGQTQVTCAALTDLRDGSAAAFTGGDMVLTHLRSDGVFDFFAVYGGISVALSTPRPVIVRGDKIYVGAAHDSPVQYFEGGRSLPTPGGSQGVTFAVGKINGLVGPEAPPLWDEGCTTNVCRISYVKPNRRLQSRPGWSCGRLGLQEWKGTVLFDVAGCDRRGSLTVVGSVAAAPAAGGSLTSHRPPSASLYTDTPALYGTEVATQLQIDAVTVDPTTGALIGSGTPLVTTIAYVAEMPQSLSVLRSVVAGEYVVFVERSASTPFVWHVDSTGVPTAAATVFPVLRGFVLDTTAAGTYDRFFVSGGPATERTVSYMCWDGAAWVSNDIVMHSSVQVGSPTFPSTAIPFSGRVIRVSGTFSPSGTHAYLTIYLDESNWERSRGAVAMGVVELPTTCAAGVTPTWRPVFPTPTDFLYGSMSATVLPVEPGTTSRELVAFVYDKSVWVHEAKRDESRTFSGLLSRPSYVLDGSCVGTPDDALLQNPINVKCLSDRLCVVVYRNADLEPSLHTGVVVVYQRTRRGPSYDAAGDAFEGVSSMRWTLNKKVANVDTFSFASLYSRARTTFLPTVTPVGPAELPETLTPLTPLFQIAVIGRHLVFITPNGRATLSVVPPLEQ